MDPALIHTIEQGDAVAKALGKADAVMLRGHGSMVVAHSIEWVFAGCVDLGGSRGALLQSLVAGSGLVYNEDETQRVMNSGARILSCKRFGITTSRKPN